MKAKTTFGALGGTSSGLGMGEVRERLQRYVGARKAHLQEVRASRFRRAIPEQDPEAFNMAIFLYLNSKLLVLIFCSLNLPSVPASAVYMWWCLSSLCPGFLVFPMYARSRLRRRGRQA